MIIESPNSYVYLFKKTWNAKRLILSACFLYLIRIILHYFNVSLEKYVFLTQKELKQLGFIYPEPGFVVCDDPLLSEAVYERQKRIKQILEWLSSKLSKTSIYNPLQKPPLVPSLPPRVLTATLAERAAHFIGGKQHITTSSPIVQYNNDFIINENRTSPIIDPVSILRNSVQWFSSPDSSSAVNLSDCSRHLHELEREIQDMSTSSRSFNDSYQSTNLSTSMNEIVQDLKSRSYQLALRPSSSQSGSTVVDDDINKSFYKRVVGQSGAQNAIQGLPDIAIGKTSVNELRSYSKTCTIQSIVIQLNQIIRYFELNPNQEYLLERIRDLSRTYLSDYNWKGGSSFYLKNNLSWSDQLPTDTELVFHLFCTYFDSKFSADPRYLDGKIFKGNYVIKQSQLNNIVRYPIAIYVYQEKPPVYKVLCNGDIYDVPANYDLIRKYFGVIIVIIAFVSRCIFVGFCWSYGTVIDEWKKTNSTLTDTELSWIGSFGQSLGGVFAPLILYLATRFGYQTIFILSLLTCSLSLLISSTVKNIHLLFLTYSIPYGFANASLFIVGTLLTGIYYPPGHEYHLLTMCIISAGFPIGYHIMSAVMFKWIQNDGWMIMKRRTGILELFLTIILGPLFSTKCILMPQINIEPERNRSTMAIRKFFSKKMIYWMIGIFTAMCSINNFLLHLHTQLEVVSISPSKADLWFRLHGLFDALFRFSIPFILKFCSIKIIYLFPAAAFFGIFVGFTAYILLDSDLPDSTCHHHPQTQSAPDNIEQNRITEKMNQVYDNIGYGT
ncbi:unnamed protein product [Didymodactylos carnosus]|uniref:Uncharacterized protein n=1 Tax=Didymodactylos carnosus TaxID=1234261 RepID=A0A8S2DMM1_9BILA|nr:unnamed protein product [Didymodactylos carnosus]CAF3724390.1 unnamed protein product [Didymodactylos carnosus]